MDLDGLRAFRAVHEARSFTAAARALGRDKAQVSRAVRALEAALGAPLFVRTTRSVRPTAEGEALYRRALPHLTALDEAVAAVPDRGAAPSGEVSITTTPDLGRVLLAPALPSFRARFPNVRVRVVLGADVVDLARTGVDLALRVGRPGAGSFIARKLADLEAGFFASPEYLERRGAPRAPADLAAHEGLWSAPTPGTRAFAPGGAPPEASVDCADFGFLAAAARAGGGVALLPTFLAARDVASGALVRVLPELRLGGAPLYLVSPPHRPLPPRIAALRAHLLERLTTARAVGR